VPEFDHNKTNYPLRGMHEKVECVSCHSKPVFTDVGKNCADCHADIHRRQVGSDCAQCHTVQGWNVAVQQVKDHQNRFPLLGAHAAVQCDECHKQLATGRFYGLSTQCDSCHLKDWQSTTNPPHASAGPAFASANCQGCHNFDSWLNAKFDHSTTGFPLTAGHANVPCASCHINNNYNLQIAPTDCGNAGCHLTTWQQTESPPHPQAGPAFAVANCSECHNTTAWTNVIFNHATTGFPLTNSHANVPCASCHINRNYNLQIAPTDCGNSGCHLTTWQQTNNPVHSTLGPAFAVANCSQCHDTISWSDIGAFNHASTGFTLTGAHATTPCGQCHANNNYKLTVTDCYNSGCHTADWNSTATLGGAVPNHVAAQFPTSLCSTCHDTINWADGKFDHSTSGWALTGGHVVPTAGGVQACTDCHINNNYSLTSANTACYGCHQAQWNSTQTLGGSIPNHLAAGYPTTCDSCHTTSSWLGATFDHTYFPLPHHASVCNDCHQVSTDYSSFTCINCHTTTAHQQTVTVNQHAGVANFVYGPTTCYNCHKNGGAG
jgi:nitrate/TMAO reductase-like tetraheme cytochrome c subunit